MKTTPQYFRVEMLRSLAAQLQELYLPPQWTRVAAVAKTEKVVGEGTPRRPAAQEERCMVVIKVEERKPIRPASIMMHLRAGLAYDGYLVVEAVSEQEAIKTLEAS